MKTIGPYTMIRKLGEGGNGEVWQCQSPSGEAVAVKVLKRGKPGSEPFKRFEAEVAVLRQLGPFPGVLPLLDAHVAGPAPHWLAMPVGQTLPEALEGASPEEIVSAFTAIADVLTDLHSGGISHRDIKPDNLFRFADRWVLGDFGLVDFPEKEPLTEGARKLGPAWYIAPEMLNTPDTADGRKADIYSLGKSLWVLLTGQRYPLPGQHDPLSAASSLRSFLRHPRAGSLDKLLEAMTALEPSKRPDAAAVKKQLDLWTVEPAPAGDVPGIQAALAAAREAILVPRAAERRQQAVIKDAERVVEDRLLSHAQGLVGGLEEQLGLEFEQGYDVPAFCKRRRVMSSRPGIWEQSDIFEVRVGSMRSVVLSVICVAELMDNGHMYCCYGLRVQPWLGQQPIGSRGTMFWKGAQAEFQLGMPEMDSNIAGLIATVEKGLPEVLAHFSELVKSHAQ